MEQIPFVTLEQATLARKIERRILNIPHILFVSCTVIPELNERPIFEIWVGHDNMISSKTIEMAVGITIRREFEVHLTVKAHPGIISQKQVDN